MSHGKGKKRHEEHEEHENHERWLVTYADMVTLLMVLFIVMFAMSAVDEKKFMELKNGLAAGFAHSTSVLPGSDTLLEQNGTSEMAPVDPQMVKQTGPEGSTNGTGHADQNAGAQTAEQIAQQVKDGQAQTKLEAMQEVNGLRDVQSEVSAALSAHGLADDVQTSIDDRGLVISLVSKHVTFAANQATLTPLGEQVVDTLGPVLAGLSEDIEVSGNTNQAPGAPKYYATDWDLSAARAVTVLRRLNEQLGVPADRLSVSAYGNTRPLMDPSEHGSQEVNKRVDLIVKSGASEDTRELMKQLANGADPATTGNPSTTTPTTPTDGQSDDSHDVSAAADTTKDHH
jgi:chemotaxis protein MotB